MTIFLSILLCLTIIFFSYVLRKNKKEIAQTKTTYGELKKLQSDFELISDEIDSLKNLRTTIYNQIEQAGQEKQKLLLDISNLTSSINEANETRNKVIETAFLQYCALLEEQYKNEEAEYDNLSQTLKDSYERLWEKLVQEKEKYAEMADEERKALEKIRATRIAATEAQLREQEIKDKQSFYSLSVSSADLFDIEALEGNKSRLAKPRILSMLIWQTYFQKQMTALCSNVLCATVVTGIYKITNQLNNKCYIGQAVDIADRWKEHAKCGLGIDTPASNKLYQAMIEDGIQNFTWELLEKCPSSELNEKEKYYIELYQAKDYGYNTLGGNSKKG